MIAFPAGTKVWIAGGVTDMRRYAAPHVRDGRSKPYTRVARHRDHCANTSTIASTAESAGGPSTKMRRPSQSVMSMRCAVKERLRAGEECHAIGAVDPPVISIGRNCRATNKMRFVLPHPRMFPTHSHLVCRAAPHLDSLMKRAEDVILERVLDGDIEGAMVFRAFVQDRLSEHQRIILIPAKNEAYNTMFDYVCSNVRR